MPVPQKNHNAETGRVQRSLPSPDFLATGQQANMKACISYTKQSPAHLEEPGAGFPPRLAALEKYSGFTWSQIYVSPVKY